LMKNSSCGKMFLMLNLKNGKSNTKETPLLK
jgi:hypothetical protein